MKPKTPEHFPSLPGVYIFKDQQHTVIYVGKAKSLKKRIASYFTKQHNDWKIKSLIEEHASIEHIVTHNEQEALLLEVQLIKQYQPKYNTLLKSGDPFLYLLFTDEEIPSLLIVRTKKVKGTYFGPFVQKQKARATYDYLVRTFKLYRCNRTIKQGCLDFHLGRCAGTCTETFEIVAYRIQMQLAQQALEGNIVAFLHIIKQQVKEHIQEFAFEKAQHLNEYAQNIDSIFAVIKSKFTERKYAKEIADLSTPEKSHLAAISPTSEQTHRALQELIGLSYTPKTIDCFDVSHFQSTYLVGSCVRFTNGEPDKNKFRRFKIKSLTEQNDYAALQEIIQRRYKNNDLPDVILIDGGKGQLSAARAVMPDATIISLAKREETIFAANLPHGYKLDLQTPLGQLLVAIRDYAHHFAISYHKLLRKKNFTPH